MTQIVFLDIDRSKIGAYRAMRIFMACRAFAQRMWPNPTVVCQAVYRDYERVGWTFYVQTKPQEMLLRGYHADLMRKTAGWQFD